MIQYKYKLLLLAISVLIWNSVVKKEMINTIQKWFEHGYYNTTYDYRMVQSIVNPFANNEFNHWV